MKNEDFENWYNLAAGVLAKQPSLGPTAPLSKLYDACFKSFAVDRDESGVHITSPTLGQDASRGKVKELEVSFADYRLTSSLDTFVTSVSLDRAREEPNPRQLGELVRTQIKACVRDIDEFIGDLEIPKIALETIFEDLQKQKAERDEGEEAKRRERGLSATPSTDGQSAAGDLAIEPPSSTLAAPEGAQPKSARGRSRAAKTGPAPAVAAPVAEVTPAQPSGHEPDASRKQPAADAGPERSEPDALPPEHPVAGAPPKQPEADNARLEEASADGPKRLYSIDRAIIQAAILREAATYLGRAVEVPPALLPIPPGVPVTKTMMEERSKYDEERLARLEDRKRFPQEAKAYTDILDWVVRAAFKLDALKDALRDERLRKEVEDKLVEVASDIDRAEPLKSLLTRAASYVVAGAAGVLAFLVLVNIAWPYFGYSMLLPVVATSSAATLGLIFSQGTLTKQSVLLQQEHLRCWLEDILRLNATSPADMLGVLTATIKIGGQPPEPVNLAEFKKSRKSHAKEKKRRSKSKAKEGDLFEFGDFGKVEADESRKIVVGLLVPFVALGLCAFPGVLPTMVAVNQAAALTGANGEQQSLAAQVLRRVSAREVCEVASGRLVWQDDQQVYLTHGGTNIVSVARSDATELRFGATRLAVEPCATQVTVAARPDVAIPEHHENVSVTNVPVVVQVTGGGGPLTAFQWQSTSYVDGVEVVVTPPADVGSRYTILSLARQPIEGLDYDRVPKEAYLARIYQFYEGNGSEGQRWSDEVETAVMPIRAALDAAAKSGCNVEIDVQGYASKKDFVPGESWSNYVLAEGRRVAVLDALGLDPVLEEKSVGAGKVKLLHSKGTVPSEVAAIKDLFRWKPRYATPDEMRAMLAEWHAEPDADNRWGESIARSVVVAISEDSLRACGAAGSGN